MPKDKRTTSKRRLYRTAREVTDDSCDWSRLPGTAIRSITIAAGLDGLQFCATCKAFRDARPPLRAMIVGFTGSYISEEKKKLFYRDEEKMKDEFCVVVGNSDKSAHRIIESIHLQYAKEITHLRLAAFYAYDNSAKGPEAPLKGSIEEHGKHLTSLRTLHIVHPTSGPSQEYSGINLGHCAVQLFLATKSTVRSLRIDAEIRLNLIRVREIIEEVGGEQLHYLHLSLVPWIPGGRHSPRGEESDTLFLRGLVQKKCTALKERAFVACHFYRPLWYGQATMPGMNGNYVLDWNDPGVRKSFLDTHQQCLFCDETVTEKSKSHPEGYRGEWCGNFRFCTGLGK